MNRPDLDALVAESSLDNSVHDLTAFAHRVAAHERAVMIAKIREAEVAAKSEHDAELLAELIDELEEK